jgi:hypothetical protein
LFLMKDVHDRLSGLPLHRIGCVKRVTLN